MGREAEEVPSAGVETHQINISMVKAAPAEVAAGADLALKVRLSCAAACDLSGKTIKIMAREAVLVEDIELSEFDGSASETGEFLITAPVEPGADTWTVVFPAQEKEGVLHQEGSVPFTFIVKPHTTSLAVWDIPFPIEPGATFQFKVGAKCSSGCSLAGKNVAVRDREGEVVATGTLSDAPYSDTVALYFAEIDLEAPGTEGHHEWTAELPKPELELPHEGAVYNFSLATVKPTEHAVTVEVMDNETNTPIKNAEVYFRHLGPPYRGRTDERGMVRVDLPEDEWELIVSASEKMPKGVSYEFLGEPFTTRGGEYKRYVPEANRNSLQNYRMPVRVDGDMVIKVELVGAIEPLEVDLDHLL